MFKIFKLAGLTLVLVSLLACSGKTQVESDLSIKGAPDWVNEGTHILKDKNGRLFHGVGSAANLNNESLQVSTADNRARSEIARVLSSYMHAIQKDYTAASGSGEEAVLDQEISRQIESATKVNLTGAKIIGRWHNKRNGSIYSIAELDMKHVKKTLKNVESMNSNLRRYIAEHGDLIFDSIAQEK